MTQRVYSSFLAANGVSLEELGLQERAFTRSDAKRAVQILRELVVPILGGDVYFQRAGRRIEPAYANWHVDKERDESPNAFADRSWSRPSSMLIEFPMHRTLSCCSYSSSAISSTRKRREARVGRV